MWAGTAGAGATCGLAQQGQGPQVGWHRQGQGPWQGYDGEPLGIAVEVGAAAAGVCYCGTLRQQQGCSTAGVRQLPM